MRKEINFLLLSSLILNSCAPLVAHAQEKSDNLNKENPKNTLLVPIPIATSEYLSEKYNEIPLMSTQVAIESPQIPTPEIPLADSCILPFEGALMEGGLQFLDVIENEGGGVIHRHLGLDFKGSTEGQTVVNMCDGTVVYVGAVKQGTGNNLGNIVAMKYTYEEGDELVNVYMRYAHMTNLSDLKPGQILHKGERLGLIGHSGGWRADQNHLHVDIMKEKTFQEIVVDRSNGDLKNEIGYYAPAELWNVGMIANRFFNPEEWIQSRLGK